MPGVLFDVIATGLQRRWRRSPVRRWARSLTALGWCAAGTLALAVAAGIGALVH